MSTTWQAIVGFSAVVGGSLMLALTLGAVLLIIDSVWEWLLSHIKMRGTMSARDEIARAHDGAALAQLGRWCLTESLGNDCSDIDGGSLQEKAIELGLLAYVTVTEPCGEDCACMDYYASDEWPHECLRETSAAMRAEG